MAEYNVNLVDGSLWMREVAGSNPATPTNVHYLMNKGSGMKEFDRVEHKDGKVIIYFKTGKLTGQFLEFPDSQLSDVISELNKINGGLDK